MCATSYRLAGCIALAISCLATHLSPASASAQPHAPEAVAARGRIAPKDGLYAISGPSGPSAVVAELKVEVGQMVARGDIIALLDDVALQNANLRRAQAQLSNARNELERNLQLQSKKMISSSDMEALELKVTLAEAELAQARALLERARVKSPIDGRVIAVHTRDGERVGRSGIVEIGRTQEMFVIAEVYETDIGRVRVGQRARAYSPALETVLTGTVERIGLKVGKMEALATDPAERTDARVVEVEIRLDDSSLATDLTNLQVEVVLEA